MKNLKSEIEKLETIKEEVIVLKKVLEVATILSDSAHNIVNNVGEDDGIIIPRASLFKEEPFKLIKRTERFYCSWEDSEKIINALRSVLSDYKYRIETTHTEKYTPERDGFIPWRKNIALEMPTRDVLSNRILDLTSNYYESRLEELFGIEKKQEIVEDTIKKPHIAI